MSGCGQKRVDGADEPLDHRRRGRRVDDVGPVLELDRQSLARGQHPGQRIVRGVDEVDADDAVLALELGERVVVEEVLQHVERVEQRLVPGAAGDVAEADVLVCHEVEPEVLDAPQQFGDGRRRCRLDADRDGVEEQSDHVLDAGQLRWPPGHGRAEHDVGASGLDSRAPGPAPW